MTQSKASGPKSSRGQSGPASRSAKSKVPDRETIILAAMELAADAGWADLTMQRIAEAAQCSLSTLHQSFASKSAIVRAMFQRIDAVVLEDVAADPFEGDESPRDRLFDVLMRRFDALTPHKQAVRGVSAVTGRNLLSAIQVANAAAPALRQSMGWMVEATGLSAGGPRGALRIKVLTAVYLAAMRVWLADDSPDSTRTMAALDANLRRAEPLLV